MENLVGRYLLAVKSSFVGLTQGKEYKIIEQIDDKLYFISDKKNKEFTTLIGSELLKLVDEWTPKCGEKVLYSYNDLDYKEGIFVAKYKGVNIIDRGHDYYNFDFIKPYKEEIKVGDWVKNKYGRIYEIKENNQLHEKWSNIKITDKKL